MQLFKSRSSFSFGSVSFFWDFFLPDPFMLIPTFSLLSSYIHSCLSGEVLTMYVYMISVEISSSPCTLGITNEPPRGVHDASPFGSAISSHAISRIGNYSLPLWFIILPSTLNLLCMLHFHPSVHQLSLQALTDFRLSRCIGILLLTSIFHVRYEIFIS